MKTVTIKIVSDMGNQTPTPTGDGLGEKPNPKTKKTKEEKTTGQLVSAYIARRAYYVAKSTATQYVNKYFNAAELYKERVSVDNAMSTIDTFVDVGTAGMVASKMFKDTGIGPVGGFVIGTLVTVATKAVQKFNELSNETQRLIDSSYGNYFNATRAGFVAGGHDTEN